MGNLFQRLFGKKQNAEPDQKKTEERKKGQLEERIDKMSDKELSKLPAYLRYPNDPISEKMFGAKMAEVRNQKCRYQFMLYTDIADTNPEIRQSNTRFPINETHVFSRPGFSSWYSVSIMNTPSVRTSRLRNSVEGPDQMGMMFNSMNQFLNLPEHLKNEKYRRVNMYYLGENAEYNALHQFEEAHVYCHIFYLGSQLFKKFILCARKDDFSWKVECTFPSNKEELIPPDFVPAGQTFGSFFS